MQSQTWLNRINGILALHNRYRANGKIASEQTQNAIKATVIGAFRDLHRLGYKIQDPKNLKHRHLQALIQYWWFDKKIAPKTLENRISRLRRFAVMSGKAGLVRSARVYLPHVAAHQLSYSPHAQHDKSWAGAGINMAALFSMIDKTDVNLGLILRMTLGFGLRREEAIKCKPHIQDHGKWFHVLRGQGKGGRERIIRIMTQSQRMILDYVKSKIPKNAYLGWTSSKGRTPPSLKANLKMYNQKLSKLGIGKTKNGVTGHGLRTQFAQNRAIICGVIPPFLGGTALGIDTEEQDMRLMQLSEDLGHHRKGVMSAYLGVFPKIAPISSYEKQMLSMAIDALPYDIEKVKENHLKDCRWLQALLYAINLDATLSQVQFLWSHWCHRNGVYWYSPKQNVRLALACSAWCILYNDVWTADLYLRTEVYHHGSGI